MAAKPKRRPTAREAVRALLRAHGQVTSGDVADAAGITRQAAHRHLRAMVEAGELFAEGAGRGARYVARRTSTKVRRAVRDTDEAVLYEQMVEALPDLRRLAPRAERLLHYVLTEMVNNAVDHSNGEWIEVEIEARDAAIEARIEDDGVGAFERVRRAFGLENAVEAIGEISKGKTTTDAEHHTGQGIFFSSKAVDSFTLESNGARWVVDNRIGDQAIGTSTVVRGTRVTFEIDRATRRELRAIFDEYTTDLEFDRTRTVVRLFGYGTTFVSRSEAKRLLHGLERFREVVLDFAGVDLVGQGFVDEVFRVWARAHPATRLLPANMVEPVAFMVQRASRETS